MAERDRIAEERRADALAHEKMMDDAWRARPELPKSKIAELLASKHAVDLSDPERPVFRGARIPSVSTPEFVSIVQAGDFPKRKINTAFHSNPFFSWSSKGEGWVVGRERFTYVYYGDDMTGVVWVGVYNGEIVILSGNEHLEVNRQMTHHWKPSPQNLETARRLLQASYLGRAAD